MHKSTDGSLNLQIRIHNKHTKFPSFGKPEAIGFFGINSEREYEDKPKFTGYLSVPRNLPIDLNLGIDQTKRRHSEKTIYVDIQNICRYISRHKENLCFLRADGGLELNADVVTCRGILRLIMCTPYEKLNDYRLRVTKFNGVLYIDRVNNEREIAEKLAQTQKHLDMCSWGYKFEQYCLSSAPNVAPDTSLPVDENEEFDCIFRTKLNQTRLLYGAEMDGIISNELVNYDNPEVLRALEFIELKTAAFQMTWKQQRNFDLHKSLNWWCQSFLVGINTILTGLRENDGIVHEIKKYNVSELHHNKPWSPAVALKFLDMFLYELNMLMDYVNDPFAVVQLDFKPKEDYIKYTILGEADAQPPMIPDWYRQAMKS